MIAQPSTHLIVDMELYATIIFVEVDIQTPVVFVVAVDIRE